MTDRTKIAICNYSFIATNGKKIMEIYDLQLAPLVGNSVEEIKADRFGLNMATMRRHFFRENKGRKNLELFNFKIKNIEIVKFYGFAKT